MHISWLGQTCVKLQVKPVDADVTILIDAYKPKQGNFPRSFSPELAFFSNGEENTATLSQSPFIINTLGEFESKGVMIYAIPSGNKNIIFRLNAENLTIVHLGHIKEALPNGEMERIMSPDILFIPVGGKPEYLDPETAAKLVTTLEPRIVIPIGYKCDNDPNAKPLNEFISQIGIKPDSTEKKVIIKQKDLPQEEMKLIALEKEI